MRCSISAHAGDQICSNITRRVDTSDISNQGQSPTVFDSRPAKVGVDAAAAAGQRRVCQRNTTRFWLPNWKSGVEVCGRMSIGYLKRILQLSHRTRVSSCALRYVSSGASRDARCDPLPSYMSVSGKQNSRYTENVVAVFLIIFRNSGSKTVAMTS